MKKHVFESTLSSDFPIAYKHIYCDYPKIHSHEYWEFMLITNGIYSHNINGKNIPLQKGMLCLIRPQDKHMLKSISEEVSQINVEVLDEAMKTQLEVVHRGFYDTLLNSEPIFFKISEKALYNYIGIGQKISLQKNDSLEQRFTISQIFLTFIQDIVKNHIKQFEQPCDNAPEKINDIINAINYACESSKTLAEILADSYYSYVHVSRLFKNHMNMTLKKYYISVKMKAAIRLLEDTTKSILEIAQNLGYKSLSHFNITFMEYFNISPAKYRKNWKEYYNNFDES